MGNNDTIKRFYPEKEIILWSNKSIIQFKQLCKE